MPSNTETSTTRARRYALALRAWVRLKNFMRLSPERNSKPWPKETVTENISSTGCYFLLDEEPRVGTNVEMEIAIPSARQRQETGKILCRGKVVRIEKEPEKGKTGVACTIDHYRLVSAGHSHHGR